MYLAFQKLSYEAILLTKLQEPARGVDTSNSHRSSPYNKNSTLSHQQKNRRFSSKVVSFSSSGRNKGVKAKFDEKLQRFTHTEDVRVQAEQPQNYSRWNLQMYCCIVGCAYRSRTKRQNAQSFFPGFSAKS